MADLAASLEATAPANTPSGRASYLRAISMITNESLYGQTVREPSNRNNAYFAPGELANVGPGGPAERRLRQHRQRRPGAGPRPATSPAAGSPASTGARTAAPGYFPRLTRAPLPR